MIGSFVSDHQLRIQTNQNLVEFSSKQATNANKSHENSDTHNYLQSTLTKVKQIGSLCSLLNGIL